MPTVEFQERLNMTRVPKLLLPALPGGLVPTSTAATVANRLHVVRAITTEAGSLDAVFCAFGAVAGNVIPVIYDCGDVTAGVYTLLAQGSSQPIGVANDWNLWTLTASLAVPVGKHLMVGFIASSATAAPGRNQLPQAGFGKLPAGVGAAPGGVENKYAAYFNMASYAAPGTVAEADFVTGAGLWSIGARYV